MTNTLDLTAQFIREYRELEHQRDALLLENERLDKEAEQGRRESQERAREVATLRHRCVELEKNRSESSSSPLQRELGLAQIRLQEVSNTLEKLKEENFRLRKQLIDCQKRLYGA